MKNDQRRSSWSDGVFMGPWVFLAAALFTSVFAIEALISAVISNHLVAGPSFVVASPSSSSSPVIVEHTPITLDDAGLRFGWNIGSAIILLGVVLLLVTFGQAGRRSREQPLFSKLTRDFLSTRWFIAAGLFAVGGAIRLLLRGRIADAAGIVEQGLSPDDDFQLFVFEVPFMALFAVSLITGWVLKQGADVLALTEDIV